jgi:hypothetical protein
VTIRDTLLTIVLVQRQGADKGHICNRASSNFDEIARQVLEHEPEQRIIEILMFQQVAKAKNRRLVLGALRAKVDAGKVSRRGQFVRSVLGCWVERFGALQKRASSEHHSQLAWDAPGDQMVRGDQFAEGQRSRDPLPTEQELRPLCGPVILPGAFAQSQLFDYCSLEPLANNREAGSVTSSEVS